MLCAVCVCVHIESILCRLEIYIYIIYIVYILYIYTIYIYSIFYMYSIYICYIRRVPQWYCKEPGQAWDAQGPGAEAPNITPISTLGFRVEGLGC